MFAEPNITIAATNAIDDNFNISSGIVAGIILNYTSLGVKN